MAATNCPVGKSTGSRCLVVRGLGHDPRPDPRPRPAPAEHELRPAPGRRPQPGPRRRPDGSPRASRRGRPAGPPGRAARSKPRPSSTTRATRCSVAGAQLGPQLDLGAPGLGVVHGVAHRLPQRRQHRLGDGARDRAARRRGRRPGRRSATSGLTRRTVCSARLASTETDSDAGGRRRSATRRSRPASRRASSAVARPCAASVLWAAAVSVVITSSWISWSRRARSSPTAFVDGLPQLHGVDLRPRGRRPRRPSRACPARRPR